MGRHIKEWAGMDFASSDRVVEDRPTCKLICGAQGRRKVMG